MAGILSQSIDMGEGTMSDLVNDLFKKLDLPNLIKNVKSIVTPQDPLQGMETSEGSGKTLLALKTIIQQCIARQAEQEKELFQALGLLNDLATQIEPSAKGPDKVDVSSPPSNEEISTSSTQPSPTQADTETSQ